ncbi:MAG: hypothetical protein CRN43_08470 [Candidatus Nephrothrix sp. EaCA]|nr:MAG: hypothetical protein CRN43_08470 [Candidatus Nephrothrix sp. EaCA]
MKTNLVYLSFFLMVGCAAQKPLNADASYYEKIDAFPDEPAASNGTEPTEIIPVPKAKPVQIEPRYMVNDKVNAVLDTISKFERSKKFLDGFVLQVYSGQSRTEAEQVTGQLRKNFPALTSGMQYIQPKFRVVAGRYFSSLQAQSDFNKVKSQFPATMLVPEMVPLK